MIRAIFHALRSAFTLHKWVHHGAEFGVRTCTTCQQTEVETYDGWGQGWGVLYEGDHSKHWSFK